VARYVLQWVGILGSLRLKKPLPAREPNRFTGRLV